MCGITAVFSKNDNIFNEAYESYIIYNTEDKIHLVFHI